MARVGASDHYHSALEPFRRDKYWREWTNRTYLEHPYHALNERIAQPDYAGLTTTSADASTCPWRFISKAEDTAADSRVDHLTRPPRPDSLRVNLEAVRGEAYAPIDGQDTLKVAARQRVRRLRASGSSNDVHLDHRLHATGCGSRPGTSCSSLRSMSVCSGRGLQARRQPRRFRNANPIPRAAGYDPQVTRPHAACAAELCGSATAEHRLPSFARVYGT